MRATSVSLRLTRIVALLLVVLVPALAGVAQSPNAALPMLELERAFPALSFDRPVLLTHAGDGSRLVYVVEQDGVIHRVNPAAPEQDGGVPRSPRPRKQGRE